MKKRKTTSKKAITKKRVLPLQPQDAKSERLIEPLAKQTTDYYKNRTDSQAADDESWSDIGSSQFTKLDID